MCDVEQQLMAKFLETKAYLAETMGFGVISELTPEQCEAIDQELEDTIDNWLEYDSDEALSLRRSGKLALRRLLFDLQALGERCLDIRNNQDDANADPHA